MQVRRKRIAKKKHSHGLTRNYTEKKKSAVSLFLTCLPLRLRSEYGFTNQIIFTAKTQRTLSDKKRGVRAGCVSEGSK